MNGIFILIIDKDGQKENKLKVKVLIKKNNKHIEEIYTNADVLIEDGLLKIDQIVKPDPTTLNKNTVYNLIGVYQISNPDFVRAKLTAD